MENIEKLQPRAFTRFCMSIGAVPSSYLASLSYEEQLLWFCSYLEKTVIPAVNNNAEAVEELQTLYTQLKSYVDHYFDNLDVQEEINNKLDEMAESGQLTDIIAQYLQLAGVLAYDTKAAMKAAENLVDGSIAKTLGTNSYNDGHGSFYKVREVQNTDIIDDNVIIALHDPDLVAEKVVSYQSDDPTNPCYYGADPTGTVDSASAINACITANKGKSIKFTPGKYIVNSSIVTPYYTDEQVNIDFAGSTLYTEENLSYVIGIGMGTHGVDMPNNDDYTKKSCYAIIENFVIDAPNSQIGIFTEQNYWYPRILNGSIFNTIVGIKLGHTASERWSSDGAIDNVYIQCKSYKNTSTRGIIINGFDNKITNSRIYNAHIGIEDNKGGNFFINNHIYLYGHLNEMNAHAQAFIDAYPTTVAFLSNGANQDRFESVYFDSYNTAFKSNVLNYCGSFLQCFYGTGAEGFNGTAFDFSQGSVQNLSIENCFIDMNSPATGGQNYGLRLGPTQNMSVLANCLNLRNNELHWLDQDLLNIDMSRNWSQPFSGGSTFLSTNFYKIMYIPLTNYTSYIVGITGGSNPNKQKARIWTGDGTSIELNNIGTSGSNYTMGAKIVTIKGVKFIELSIKTSSDSPALNGMYVEAEKSRDFIGVIPVIDRAVWNANPADFTTTTPTYTIGFEY